MSEWQSNTVFFIVGFRVQRSLMASIWIHSIILLVLAMQLQPLVHVALASTNVSFEFSWIIYGGYSVCSSIQFLWSICLVGLFLYLVLAGSHCVYGRETAWWTWTRSKLPPWGLIQYTWKVSVLTPCCQHSLKNNNNNKLRKKNFQSYVFL